MNRINTKNKIAMLPIAMLAALLLAGGASAQQAKTPLRRAISNSTPLFVYSSVYNGAKPSQLSNFWKLLPDDVRPYFGVHVNPAKKDSPATRAWIESVLDEAQRLGAPAIIEVEGFDSQNDTPMEYWSSLFDKYPVLIGLNISEISATGGLTGGNLNDELMEKIARYIAVAAPRGGYFIWQDMCWDWPFTKYPHVFVKAGAGRALFDAISSNGAHVILTHKHNGNGRRFTSDAAAMGFWASGITAAWGVHSESWIWWESGYERLYAPSTTPNRSKTPWKSVFSYPEALYGIEWLIAATQGASIFSMETFFQGYSSNDGARPTPAFSNVVLPLIRQIIRNKLIPGRAAALSKIKTAYRPSKAAPPALKEDALFKGLYGPETSTRHEWLPSTGRYYIIPIIPALAPKSAGANFPNVIDDTLYKEKLSDPAEKKKYFDALYPPETGGDSWLVNIGNIRRIANPNENTNATTTFDFTLTNSPGVKISGELPTHTFAIIAENPAALHMHINNYRTDSSSAVWDNKYLEKDDTAGFLDNDYIPNPADAVTRRTTITLTGLTQKPSAKITTGKRGSYETAYDKGTMKITLDHNGTMDIEINLNPGK